MLRFALLIGDRIVDEYAFDKGAISVGRHKAADIVIPNRSVSRRHARIQYQSGRCVITDLGAKNALFYKGRAVSKQELRPGDSVQLGKYALRFDGEDGERAPAGPHAIDVRAALERHGDRAPRGTNADDMEFEEGTVAISAETLRERDRLRAPQLVALGPDGEQQVHRLDKGQLVVGKNTGCDIRLTGFFAPAIHCHIVQRRDGGIFVQTRSGRPKLLLNGRQVQRAMLQDGDVLAIGRIRLVVRAGR